jgi:protease-4|eukprot:COSAG02_NODE_3108_length_7351_cov_11.684225_5_plen_303_part_00
MSVRRSRYATLNGFAQRSVLLRGLLDTVGVEPEISQIGPWKGGHVLSGDPTDGVGEPTEVKEQTSRMLAEQRRRYVDGVVADSGMQREAVDALLSGGAMGKALCSSDLFTSVRYEDEVACEVLQRAASSTTTAAYQPGTKTDGEHEQPQSPEKANADALWLSLATYSRASASALGLESKRTPWYRALVGTPKAATVAVVPLTGQIFFGEGGRSSTPRIFHEPAVAAIRAAAERTDIKAVVLRVDSPGGDALASELIWRAVGLLGNEKPVLASMGSVAASGGSVHSHDSFIGHEPTTDHDLHL